VRPKRVACSCFCVGKETVKRTAHYGGGMPKTDTAFKRRVKHAQRKWRRRAIPDVGDSADPRSAPGTVGLPEAEWEQGLFPDLRSDGAHPLSAYLESTGVHWHGARNQLHSSWTLCANLYFPFGRDAASRALLTAFWAQHLEALAPANRPAHALQAVTALELEYAEAEGTGREPAVLLGELSGARGRRQTSPDVGLMLEFEGGGKGLVLMEVKYTEHSFYNCSRAQELDDNTLRRDCVDAWQSGALLDDPETLCAQARERKRPYLALLVDTFRRRDPNQACHQCPALRGGYQLFRQQALAAALQQTDTYDFVLSAVAYDPHNSALTRSLWATGLEHALEGWTRLAQPFIGIPHDDWVGFVRDQPNKPAWCDAWVEYIADRYGYGAG